jgi:hypothetical protein
LRQKGIGVLAAAFLVRRWDSKKRTLKRNVTGAGGQNLLGTFEFDSAPVSDRAVYEGTGYRPGLDIVSAKYRVAASAMSAVSSDIEKYLKRKNLQSAKTVFAKG